MNFKKTAKKAWKDITSKKAKVGYMKIGTAMKTGGEKAAKYFDRTNQSLDRIVGTRDPNRGQLTGVIPIGYKIKIIPKVIRSPRGYHVVEERHLVKIGGKKRKVIKKIKRKKRKVVKKIKRKKRR